MMVDPLPETLMTQLFEGLMADQPAIFLVFIQLIKGTSVGVP